MRHPKWLLIVGVILATGLLSTGAASGLTAWQQFGAASGTHRGAFGAVGLRVASTTKLNPEALRLVVTAPSNPVETFVSWNVDCWNRGDSTTTNLGGGFSATPPIERVITEVTIANFNYCELDVTATTPGVRGSLKLSLQAQYP
jgi:hypothetical protein